MSAQVFFGRDFKHIAISGTVLLKGPEVRGTRSKDTIGVKRFGDEVSETEMGRRPSTAGETTVQPLLGTVGSVRGSVAVSTGTAYQRAINQ